MATSKLQIAVGDLLDKTFPQYRVRENYRPDWLVSSNNTKLELDFYIEELNIGIEVQGVQHYEYTPFFYKDYAEYELRLKYDQEKKDLCHGLGIQLIELYTLMDAIVQIRNIEESTGELVAPKADYRTAKQQRRAKHPRKSSVEKYLLEAQKTELRGDPSATMEQKITEIIRFRKKVKKFRDKGGKGNNHEIPFFAFEFLSYTEQCALLEEYGIQDQVLNSRNSNG